MPPATSVPAAGEGYTPTNVGVVATRSTSNIPTGTVAGTLVGTYGMTGALKGDVTLSVAFDGALAATDAGVARSPATTHTTGTATSGSGTYTVDVTR